MNPFSRIVEPMVKGALKPAAHVLQRDYMKLLGYHRTMRIANAFNRRRFGENIAYRKAAYEEHFDELIEEHGPLRGPIVEMRDGWALDTSGALPHLDRVLDASEKIIKERSGVRREHFGRPFFQDLLAHDDEEYLRRFPALLDFATSSEILSTVAHYLEFVPHLSPALPRGIRCVESSIKFDDTPSAPPRASQLFHLDPYSVPDVYVMVAVRDITPDQGPFCFLPASDSRKFSQAFNYGRRGVPSHVSDEQVFSVVDESRLQRFACPAGSVLFLDSSACFHFGSRNCSEPRYQLMYAFVSPCRYDFADILNRPLLFSASEDDSRLRAMVLDRECAGSRRRPKEKLL